MYLNNRNILIEQRPYTWYIIILINLIMSFFFSELLLDAVRSTKCLVGQKVWIAIEVSFVMNDIKSSRRFARKRDNETGD